MTRQFTLTEDGSHTIFVPEMGEHYHSTHGAIQESRHIFIQNGYEKIPGQKVSVLELGFGTGLNAFLTLLCSLEDGRSVHYEAWEAFPLPPEESELLNYPDILQSGRNFFNLLHRSEWEEESLISPLFVLRKVREDFRNFQSGSLFDLVYFDAFGPRFQPELWSEEVFRSIAACMKENSRLVTYSAQGQVRRNLRESGFRVEKAPGPPGKREISIAIKI
jgi:tRNA U34 5-methylaminomethyl-2-thiouridine-forming methyltransferase MnmC